jgi:hypothetical protein
MAFILLARIFYAPVFLFFTKASGPLQRGPEVIDNP